MQRIFFPLFRPSLKTVFRVRTMAQNKLPFSVSSLLEKGVPSSIMPRERAITPMTNRKGNNNSSVSIGDDINNCSISPLSLLLLVTICLCPEKFSSRPVFHTLTVFQSQRESSEETLAVVRRCVSFCVCVCLSMEQQQQHQRDEQQRQRRQQTRRGAPRVPSGADDACKPAATSLPPSPTTVLLLLATYVRREPTTACCSKGKQIIPHTLSLSLFVLAGGKYIILTRVTRYTERVGLKLCRTNLVPGTRLIRRDGCVSLMTSLVGPSLPFFLSSFSLSAPLTIS